MQKKIKFHIIRTVGATNMNEHSSRSHAIFIVTIECSCPTEQVFTLDLKNETDFFCTSIIKVFWFALLIFIK